jgi:hypothetical protein
MTIKNRQQVLAFLAIGAIALLVADRFVLTPLIKSWKDRSARVADLKKSISQGALLLEREETIRERWSVMSTNTLPENVSSAENTVLKAFDRWSQESRISITSLKPQWRQNEDDYMTLECRADAFGSIEAVTRFLHEVEIDPLALKIESVELAARDKEGQQLALGLQISALLLIRNE